MTAHRLLLEDFSQPLPEPANEPPTAPAVDLEALEAKAEAARLESYETGYKTGWDDAVRAAEEERRGVSEELARNLREVGLTFVEAREDLAVGLRAFMREFVDAMFPALLAEAAAASLAEALGDMAQDACSEAIALSVSPEDSATIQSLLPLPDGAELAVLEEPALAPGQSRLKAGAKEYHVDAERIVEMVRGAIGKPQPQAEDAADE